MRQSDEGKKRLSLSHEDCRLGQKNRSMNILIPLIVGPAMSRQEEKQPYGHGQYPQIKQAIVFPQYMWLTI